MMKLTHDQEDEIERLYVGGCFSLRKLGDRFGVSHESVRQVLLDRGIEMRDRLCSVERKLHPVFEAQLVEMYRSGASSREVGEAYGFSHTSVLRMVRRSGEVPRKSGMERALDEQAFRPPMTPTSAFWLGVLWSDPTIEFPPRKEPRITVAVWPPQRPLLDGLKAFLKTSLRVRHQPPGNVTIDGVTYNQTEHYFLDIRSGLLAHTVADLNPAELPYQRSFARGVITKLAQVKTDDEEREFIEVDGPLEKVEWLRRYLDVACSDWATIFETRPEYGLLTIWVDKEELLGRLTEPKPAPGRGTMCQTRPRSSNFVSPRPMPRDVMWPPA